jgi:hypothetical protein
MGPGSSQQWLRRGIVCEIITFGPKSEVKTSFPTEISLFLGRRHREISAF